MINLELRPDVEQELAKRAEERGVSLSAYVKDMIETAVEPQLPRPRLSREEWLKELDRLGENVPPGPPLSDYAVSRESIYGDED